MNEYLVDNNDLLEDDTIFALSSGGSAAQATAVAIIRISGTQAPAILQSLTTPGTPLPKPRYAALRKLYYKEQPLDQALVLYFPGPHSFTGEDVVELHCHGSRAVVQGVLEAISDSSKLARYAEAGEFTQRAWRNGKMDVLQVEALADLLTADTNSQRLQALQQLEGKLSETYQSWREKLIAGLAHAEAVIDFGDDERFGDDDFENPEVGRRLQQESVWGGVIDQMQSLRKEMEVQLSDQRRGELVREGVRISILGPPNAGKSSLFNVLAQRDAAIVSDTPGTTRDVLELTLNLGGVKCILQDTAGVRTETDDTIEREGMKRAFAAASQADLIVSMIDSTDYQAGITILDRVLTECIHTVGADDDDYDDTGVADVSSLTPGSVLLVRNKYDLLSNGSSSSLYPATTDDLAGIFDISCVTQEGIDHFLDNLTSLVLSRVSGAATSSSFQSSGEGALITRARHRQHVTCAVDALKRFDFLSRQGTIAVDMAAEELRLAASELGRITGAVDVEDVLDKLFTDFCIGK
ncbi:tRNA modification GTPase [Fistulifera solaris]|uniref:tRNA modification GTPase n=1 Tax=Fistulifera solaris TaxID=1519565 RepID=A0A1Z5JBN4_FISSO|nr:tRNA modification GTPase [Fistulifera solaris]|eukprot:GAX11181.1 tRNA modification GTPase [Fistulifera solaris]